MIKVITGLCAVAVALVPVAAASQQAARAADTKVLSITGAYIGTAKFTQTPQGVRIELDATGLPPGEHGVAFHEIGSCNPYSAFATAQRHLGADAAPHGQHAGDLPNQKVADDGKLRIDLVAPKVSLTDSGPGALLDADESALIVGEKRDDGKTNPDGAMGRPIACALVTRAP